jgi:hypothetical protein
MCAIGEQAAEMGRVETARVDEDKLLTVAS